MGVLFDKITEKKEIKRGNLKLGEYSLESDKYDIKELKNRIKENEECFLIISGTYFNSNWKIAVTNSRIILIRKKIFNNEIKEKNIYLKDIVKLNSKKGVLLSELKIITRYEEFLITNISTLYFKKFLELINNQIKISGSEGVVESKIETKISKQQEEKQYQKERLKQLKRDHIPYCPKCKSTSLTYANKKLSISRAVTGGILLGPIGAAVGGITSKQGYVQCLNCGHKWKL